VLQIKKHHFSVSLFSHILTRKLDHLISDMNLRVPSDRDGSPYALMSRAALRMYAERSFGGFAVFGRDGEIVVYNDRLDADGFAHPNNPPVNVSGIGGAIKRNLAP
jgi:hypothetical protein